MEQITLSFYLHRQAYSTVTCSSRLISSQPYSLLTLYHIFCFLIDLVLRTLLGETKTIHKCEKNIGFQGAVSHYFLLQIDEHPHNITE